MKQETFTNKDSLKIPGGGDNVRDFLHKGQKEAASLARAFEYRLFDFLWGRIDDGRRIAVMVSRLLF